MQQLLDQCGTDFTEDTIWDCGIRPLNLKGIASSLNTGSPVRENILCPAVTDVNSEHTVLTEPAVCSF